MRAVSDPSDVELADEELSLVEMSRLLLHGSYTFNKKRNTLVTTIVKKANMFG
jgi:hypothetical protein